MGIRRLSVAVGACLGGLLAISVLPGSAGCTYDDPAPADDSAVDPVDTGAAEADAEPPRPTVRDTTGADVPADFSCAGKRDGGVPDAAPSDAPFEGGTPTAGQLAPTSMELFAFGEGTTHLAGAEVQLFYGNSFKGAADLTGVVSDGSGLATALMPAGWQIAYRIVPKDTGTASTSFVSYYELDQLVPTTPGAKMPFFGMTKAKYQDLALALAGQRDYAIPAGTGIIAARVTDCQRRYVRNVSVELVDVTEATPTPVTFVKDCLAGPCVLYLSDLELPSPATTTSRQGLVALVNIPSSRKLRLVAHGYVNGDANATVASRDVEMVDQAITTLFAQP